MPLSMRFGALLLITSLTATTVHTALADGFEEDAKGARAFCASPSFRSLECGFTTEAEDKKTTSNQCPLCGTAYSGYASLPQILKSHPSYGQWVTDVISLACQGRVLVRSVFKIVSDPSGLPDTAVGSDCSYVYLDNTMGTEGAKSSPVVRCELELPAGPGREEDRAVKAKEGNCWICDRCNNGGGCPSQKGRWYSDSYTTSTTGCASSFSGGYTARKAGIYVNPRVTFNLVKFGVCNSPGCFDAQYEDAKLKRARRCIQGRCAGLATMG